MKKSLYTLLLFCFGLMVQAQQTPAATPPAQQDPAATPAAQQDPAATTPSQSVPESFSLISESVGFLNTKSGFSNYYKNNSKLYKKRQQHINEINDILIQLKEYDNSAYFKLQASTCASKKTNEDYERCMKRVIQEVYLKIKTDKNKNSFLKMLSYENINIKGLNDRLI